MSCMHALQKAVIKTALSSAGVFGLLQAGWTTIKVRSHDSTASAKALLNGLAFENVWDS